MHQTKKGKQWYFGMKAHVGVDGKTKMIHSVAATPANVHDSHLIADLLHGGETRVWGDSAYAGQSDTIQARAPAAKDLTRRRGRGYKYLSEYQRRINRARSRVRACAEHAIGVVKRAFQFTKVCYRLLPRHREERQSVVRCLCAGESVHGAQVLVQSSRGVVRLDIAKQQYNERIGDEKHPDSMRIRIDGGQLASASVSVGNCSDVA